MESIINFIRVLSLTVIGLCFVLLSYKGCSSVVGLWPKGPKDPPPGVVSQLVSHTGKQQAPPCVGACPRRSQMGAQTALMLVKQKDGSVQRVDVPLDDIILIQVNHDNSGCVAYGKDQSGWEISHNLATVETIIQERQCDYFCKTNRRDLINTCHLDKYDRCNKKVLLDNDLESEVTGERGKCIDKMLTVMGEQ